MKTALILLYIFSFAASASSSKAFICEGKTDQILMEIAHDLNQKLSIQSMVFDGVPFLLEDILVDDGKPVAVPDDGTLYDVLITKNGLNLGFKLYNVASLNEVFIKTDQDFIECEAK